MAADEQLQYTLTLTTLAAGSGAKETAADLKAVSSASTELATTSAVGSSAVKNLASTVVESTGHHESYRHKQKEVIEVGHMLALMTGGELREGMHGSILSLKLLTSMTGNLSMGIVGAAMVIGTGIAMIGEKWKESGKEAKEAAKEHEEAMKKVEEEAGKLNETNFKKLKTSLEDEEKSVEALKNEFTYAREESDKLALAELTNSASIHKAWENLNTVLGIRTDKIKELTAIEDAASKKREVQYQQDLAAEQRKAKSEEDAVKQIEKKIEDNRLLQETQAGVAERNKDRLKELNEKKSGLDEIVKAGDAYDTSATMMGGGSDMRTDEANSSRVELKALNYDKEKSEITGRIEKAEKMILDTKEGEKRLLDALATAWDKKQDTDKGVEKAIERLTKTKVTEDAVDKINVVADSGKVIAEDLKKETDGLVANSKEGAAVLSAVKDLTADGTLHAEKLNDARSVLSKLIGQLQVGGVTDEKNQADLIQYLTNNQNQVAVMANAIRVLEREQARITSMVQSPRPAQ